MFPGESLPQVKSPLDKNDHPERDNSEQASDDLITKLMCMVGQLQWAVIFGRYDNSAHVMRSPVYQFGFLIRKDYKHALQLDEPNGNSKWYDATKLEMDQINEYKVFQDHGKAQFDTKSRKVSNAPNGYRKIRVHLIFAVKHDGRHKARLVAGGHLTPDHIESIYSGVLSIRSLRLVIFLVKLNNLKVWGADIDLVRSKDQRKVICCCRPRF